MRDYWVVEVKEPPDLPAGLPGFTRAHRHANHTRQHQHQHEVGWVRGVLRVCTEPGCPELVTRGYCTAHARKPWAKETLTPGRLRGPAAQEQRRRVLREQPWCASSGCTFPSQQVDHIVPLSRGGHPTDRANLQGLCATHHTEKTRAERRRGE